ncbi:glycosyltransferase [Sphingomonas sp.]|uniref:glycosyltransferase family 2 protein n=1 Tax=Sphingomonas sp. TaxID=28214 RepID=UPI001B2A26F5|nr:glycosyltransferase [Sphingomonas sp.]MBO9713841.1 glycosyltransferase [Sphingomonas sp.]
MREPAVSVIMAAYNGASLVRETVRSLIAQTFTDWELVAVDDCSRDDTAKLLEAFDDRRIRVIRAEANGGPVLARNRAFAEARGRYIAALDQDDVCLPGRLARQVGYLDAHPETVLVSTAANVLTGAKVTPGHWVRPLTPGLIDWLMLVQNPIVWSTVMFRAEAARRLEPFERPEMRYVEDFDLYHRLRRFGPIAQIDEPLLLYRVHEGGASQMFTDTMRANAETLIAERHAARMGREDPGIAPLVVRHCMGGEPVPDAETLRTLIGGIMSLRRDFETRGHDARTLALVDREISRLWWRLCRACVRSGTLPIHVALAQRPETIGFGEGRTADLMLSQVIGGVRAIRRGRG